MGEIVEMVLEKIFDPTHQRLLGGVRKYNNQFPTLRESNKQGWNNLESE
jgi:hypothetical protein